MSRNLFDTGPILLGEYIGGPFEVSHFRVFQQTVQSRKKKGTARRSGGFDVLFFTISRVASRNTGRMVGGKSIFEYYFVETRVYMRG